MTFDPHTTNARRTYTNHHQCINFTSRVTFWSMYNILHLIHIATQNLDMATLIACSWEGDRSWEKTHRDTLNLENILVHTGSHKFMSLSNVASHGLAIYRLRLMTKLWGDICFHVCISTLECSIPWASYIGLGWWLNFARTSQSRFHLEILLGVEDDMATTCVYNIATSWSAGSVSFVREFCSL